jgi:Nif-specific regulatory protein
VVFAGGPEVLPSHLPLPQPQRRNDTIPPQDGVGSFPPGLTLAEVERRYISRTLEDCAGNRTRAAELLGIGRNTLVRKIKEYGL